MEYSLPPKLMAALRGTARYRGTPMPAHVALPGLEPEMFHRWLTLFDETVRDIERRLEPKLDMLVSARDTAAADVELAERAVETHKSHGSSGDGRWEGITIDGVHHSLYVGHAGGQ